jgi:PST family polysaccharide transporter
VSVGVVFSILTLVSVAAGIPWGAVGVAMSISFVWLCIRLPLQYHIVGRSGPVTAKDLYGVFLRHLPLAAVVGGVTWMARIPVKSFPPIVQLAVGGLAAVASAVAFIAAMPSLRQEALYIIEHIRRVVAKPAGHAAGQPAAV